MEATFNWPWIADLAAKCGLRAHIGDPMRIKHLRKGLPKSDRKDAIGTGTLWLKNMFPEAYLAPPDVRAMRGTFRMRGLFVRMRTALKNNIQGQLMRIGVTLSETSDAYSLIGRRALRRLDLEDHEATELRKKLALLDDLEIHIASLTRTIQIEVRENEDARLLDTLPGFGEITSHGFLSEIGTVSRFPNGRALAAYGGTLPLDNESADVDYGKHVGKHSNRFLRWIVLEALNGALRKSARMRSLHARVLKKNKGMPGKARMAVARELMELAHLILTRRVPYVETPPPRPGSEGRKRRTDKNKKSRARAMNGTQRRRVPVEA
jgi:transposase